MLRSAIVAALVIGAAGVGSAQGVRVVDLGGGIVQAIGVGVGGGSAVRVPQSNTFLVMTDAGHVVIDTSLAAAATAHKQALLAGRPTAAMRAIILTHAHGDHTGGIGVWREPGTDVIAQRNYPEFIEYTNRLSGYFGRANAAQFGLMPGAAARGGGSAAVNSAPNLLFDERYVLDVGATRFEILHTPGETPDHLTVWIPSLKAAFIGDNYYESFPNIYTLRGTRPRWALDYIRSLDRVLALDPELVLPSHGEAIRGRDEIRRRLTRYRDAIRYVHDETVKGMNAGTDVLTLMREITLPSELDVGESYGRISWSVRGIYEGYVGWFDGNVSTMFGPPRQAYGAMVTVAGGADRVAARARELASSDPLTALYLTDMALEADPTHTAALEARIAALEALDARSDNSNERGWLAAGLREARARLKK